MANPDTGSSRMASGGTEILASVVPKSDRARRVSILVAIFAVAYLYRFAPPRFDNDHFDHLSKAQHVLRGEYPVRDFLDPGRPLTIALSAAALGLTGETLFGEALLTVGALALGVVLVYHLTLQLSGSMAFAGWAAACILAIEPRLYNYPKVLVATLAVWLAFRYVDAPGRARAAALGAWGAVGFLFRHDLGAYVAILCAATVILTRRDRHPRLLIRDGAAAAATAAVVAAPYVWFLLQNGALTGNAVQGGTALLGAVQLTWRPFQFGPGPDAAPWLRHNAENWLYYFFVAMPAVTAALVVRRRPGVASATIKAGALAVLCITVVLTLVRGNLDSRLPDVAAPSFILAGWMLATLWTAKGVGTPRRRAAAACAALTLAAITTASTMALANENPLRRLASIAIRLPGSVTEPTTLLRGDPLVLWEREGTTDVRGLARWMRECTAPDDRLLVFGHHPAVFFHAQRLFAGGMLFFSAGYFSDPASQRLTVERLADQAVPFVVIEATGTRALEDTYAIVGEHVLRNYSLATETNFGGDRSFLIYASHEVTPIAFEREGLPCLQEPAR